MFKNKKSRLSQSPRQQALKNSTDDFDLYRALLEYSLRLLSKKSYTVYELTKKLVQRCKKVGCEDGFASDIEKVLARLTELNYIDDAKILENFINYSVPDSPVGKFKYLHKMRQRGIPYKQAESAWNKADLDEGALARKVAATRLKRYEEEPVLVKRKKIMNFLAARGFSPNLIYEVLSEI